MHANEINQHAGDQRLPFKRMRKQLTHGKGNRALATQQLEPLNMFGRERIFKEEQPVWFKGLSHAYGLGGCKALVDIVQQFDLESYPRPDVIEETRDTLCVAVR